METVSDLYADQSITVEDEGQNPEDVEDLVRKLSEGPSE